MDDTRAITYKKTGAYEYPYLAIPKEYLPEKTRRVRLTETENRFIAEAVVQEPP
jgi:hypothetical protein